MTLVKICGIREYEHANVAANAGADLIGFVFVPVRREIKPDVARSIIDRVRNDHARPPAMIGLFVNETADTINRVVEMAGLDLVQLHGDETPEMAAQINVPVIKALRLDVTKKAEQARRDITPFLRTCSGVLLDSHVPGHWGGTGVVGDWDVAAELTREFPAFLAGGLSPANVAEAIQQVSPAGVDVSSGVETDGRKDVDKIREFLTTARNCEHELRPPEAAIPLMGMIETIRAQRPLVTDR